MTESPITGQTEPSALIPRPTHQGTGALPSLASGSGCSLCNTAPTLRPSARGLVTGRESWQGGVAWPPGSAGPCPHPLTSMPRRPDTRGSQAPQPRSPSHPHGEHKGDDRQPRPQTGRLYCRSTQLASNMEGSLSTTGTETHSRGEAGSRRLQYRVHCKGSRAHRDIYT